MDDRNMKKRLRSFGVFAFLEKARAAMTNLEAAHPEQNVLGDVGGVIRNSLEMPGGEHKMKIRSGKGGIASHAGKKRFKNRVAIAVHDIVAFKHLGGEIHILVDQCAEALGDHGAN